MAKNKNITSKQDFAYYDKVKDTIRITKLAIDKARKYAVGIENQKLRKSTNELIERFLKEEATK